MRINNYNNIIRKNIILTIVVAMLSVLSATAQSFTVEAPSQVVAGDQFQVAYTVKNATPSSRPKIAEIPGCRLVYGPATSQSSSYSYNGHSATSSTAISYIYTYIAEKAGTYNVKGATIVVNGKTLTSRNFSIQVHGSSNQMQQSKSSAPVDIDDPTTMQSGRKVSANDVFVRINISKNSAYEQEAVVCTIKLYTKYSISQFMPTVQPSFEGFISEDLNVEARLNNIEVVNGQKYYTAILKQAILYPQKSGTLKINSGNYDVTVVQYREESFGPFVTHEPVEKQIKISSNSASMNVMALPEPRPASFNGAVGVFSLSAKMNTEKFRTGEAAALVVDVKGTGNIKYLKSPLVSFPDNFDSYDPQESNDVKTNEGNMTGTATWNYTFIPQHIGDFEIPKVEFTFFNTNTKKYETLSSGGWKFHVNKGSNNSSSADMPVKNTDIRYIHTGNISLNESNNSFVGSYLYWLCIILPITLYGVLLYVYRKQIKARANISLMKNRKAGKVARKRLKVAMKYMSSKDMRFYEETLKAIWGYLSDKLTIPVSELNKENIASELAKYGADTNLIDSVMDVLEECEFAQYAPSQSATKMDDVFAKTSDFMDKIESIRR